MPIENWRPGADPLSGFGQPAYDLPVTWTAFHVLRRMIEAFEILQRCGGRVLPQGFKTAWPGYLHDALDGAHQRSNMVMPDGMIETNEARDERCKIDAEGASRRIKLPPSAHELSLMDEAIAWPLLLQGESTKLVLPFWAFRTARERSVPQGMALLATREAALIAGALRHLRKVVR